MKPEYKEKYPHLFEPFTVGKGKSAINFKNRVLVPPMVSVMGHNFLGGINDYMGVLWHGDMARGGFSSICMPFEVPHDGGHPGGLEIDSERTFSAYHTVLRYVHGFDCRASAEIYHAGCNMLPELGHEPISASDMTWNGHFVRAMNEEDMEKVIAMYANCAAYSKKAGFDFITLHFGHGWLISNYLSPLSNRRTDKYGGSVENRCRFPLMVIDGIRKAVGDMPIEIRMNGNDRAEGGITPEDAVEQAKIFAPYVDMIHFTCGNRLDALTRPWMHPTSFVEPGHNTDASSLAMKAGLGIPVGVVGSINTPELAERILAEGMADYVLMARQARLDPEWVKKVKEGREEDIKPCLRCDVCNDRNRRGALTTNLTFDPEGTLDLRCSINPYYGQGYVRRMHNYPPTRLKKVGIVGGGPAGMQCALDCANRGHTVTLFEKSDALGGQIKLYCDTIWHKKEFRLYVDYMTRQLEKAGVDIRLNTEATPDMVSKMDFDALVVAVGAEEIHPDIPGIEGKNVKWGWDVYQSLEGIGHNVVVVGGGMCGCELGLLLNENGHKSTVLGRNKFLAPKECLSQRMHIKEWMDKNGVIAYTQTEVTRITQEGVYASTPEGERFFPADTVVVSLGAKPLTEERDKFKDTAFEVFNIGDCVKASDMVNATDTGNGIAMYI